MYGGLRVGIIDGIRRIDRIDKRQKLEKQVRRN